MFDSIANSREQHTETPRYARHFPNSANHTEQNEHTEAFPRASLAHFARHLKCALTRTCMQITPVCCEQHTETPRYADFPRYARRTRTQKEWMRVSSVCSPANSIPKPLGMLAANSAQSVKEFDLNRTRTCNRVNYLALILLLPLNLGVERVHRVHRVLRQRTLATDWASCAASPWLGVQILANIVT